MFLPCTTVILNLYISLFVLVELVDAVVANHGNRSSSTSYFRRHKLARSSKDAYRNAQLALANQSPYLSPADSNLQSLRTGSECNITSEQTTVLPSTTTDNYLEDLLSKGREQLNRSISVLEDMLVANNKINGRESSSLSANSINFGTIPTITGTGSGVVGSYMANTNANPRFPDLNNSLGARGKLTTSKLDYLEKIEMHTNNHQSLALASTIGGGQQHSRHYNAYQANSLTSQLDHHGPANNKHHHFGGYGSGNPNHALDFQTKPSSGSNSNAFAGLLQSSASLGMPFGGLSMQNNYGTPSAPSQHSVAGGQSTPSDTLSSINVHKQQSTPASQQQPASADLTSIDYSGVAACGRQQVSVREPRIVGGNSTYEGEFPWAVSIQRHGNHHCGGVIVGRRWILTAAHCVRSQLVANLIVRTGGHTLGRSPNSINSHLERDYLVEQIVMHGDFSRYDNLTASQMKSSANTNNADIALLRLKHEILWNELAWPVCFPNKEAGNFSGHDAIVIGWGKLNEKSEDFSNELQKVKLTIIDNKLCQNWFRQAGREMPIDDRIICAGFKSGGKDACHGDSGGPLLSRINGHYVVVGVVSTGIGCARPLLPGLYSRVSSYIGWIERYVTN